MKLVVGLGNPGERYRRSRHNAGFRIVECLAERAAIALDDERYDGHYGEGWAAGEEVALLLPQTHMNASGQAVIQALRGLATLDPERDLLIVLDDIDLSLGRLRLRPRGSDGGQRGLRDVIEWTGSEAVPRLRFGVGRPPPGLDPVEWVLAPFRADEERVLRRALPRAADAVLCFLSEGAGPAMDRFNGPPEPDPGVPPDA